MRRAALVCAALVAIGAHAAAARAQVLDTLAPDIELFAAGSLDPLGQEAFEIGGGAAVHMEVITLDALGLHFGGAIVVLPPESQPRTTWWFGGRVGLRLHWSVLLDLPGDGYLDAHYSLGRSFEVVRQGFDAGLGYSIRADAMVAIGPFVRFMFAHDPADNHPMLLLAGLSVALGDNTRMFGVEDAPDLDRDRVPDEHDLCPETHVGRFEDPAREGCPAPDGDMDGVVDHLDACTSETMWPHPDERNRERYGCPLADRDEDGVPDDWDQCPDEFAPNGGDALAEGCITDPY